MFFVFQGEVVGTFSSSQDISSSIVIEVLVMAVIKGIEFSWVRD